MINVIAGRRPGYFVQPLRHVIDESINLNGKRGDRYRPIMVICEKGSFEVIKYTIDKYDVDLLVSCTDDTVHPGYLLEDFIRYNRKLDIIGNKQNLIQLIRFNQTMELISKLESTYRTQLMSCAKLENDDKIYKDMEDFVNRPSDTEDDEYDAYTDNASYDDDSVVDEFEEIAIIDGVGRGEIAIIDGIGRDEIYIIDAEISDSENNDLDRSLRHPI